MVTAQEFVPTGRLSVTVLRSAVLLHPPASTTYPDGQFAVEVAMFAEVPNGVRFTVEPSTIVMLSVVK